MHVTCSVDSRRHVQVQVHTNLITACLLGVRRCWTYLGHHVQHAHVLTSLLCVNRAWRDPQVSYELQPPPQGPSDDVSSHMSGQVQWKGYVNLNLTSRGKQTMVLRGADALNGLARCAN